MSKTLSLKKADPTYTHPLEASATPVVIQPFTAAQLREMLAALEPNGVSLDPTRAVTDVTMDLPIAPTDASEMAAKAALPPASERKAGAAPQLPPAIHGSFSLGGIPVIAPGVNLAEHINPATGAAYVQPGLRPRSQIQPTASRRFDGRA